MIYFHLSKGEKRRGLRFSDIKVGEIIAFLWSFKTTAKRFFWEAAGLSSGGCDDAVVLRRNAFCRHAAICVQISSSLMNTNQMLCFSSTDICCNVSSITLFHQSLELLDQKISLYCKLGIKETKSKCWGLIVCHKGKLVFNGIVHSKIKKDSSLIHVKTSRFFCERCLRNVV